MHRLVLACVVAIFAITTYRCIVVDAQPDQIDRGSNNTSTNLSVAGGGSTTSGSSLDLTCPKPTLKFPPLVNQCIQNVPANYTLTLASCKLVDNNPVICECSSMTYNNTVDNRVTGGTKVYIPLDTCNSIPGSGNCDCKIPDSVDNTTAPGAGKAKAAGGSATAIYATPVLLLGSILVALLTKMFP